MRNINTRRAPKSQTTHLLPPGTGTATTKLLGLHPPGVGDKESSVVCNKSLLQLDSRGSILVLGVEASPKSV